MEVVLPNGDIIETSPAPKHAAGPDLNQIFIGSEGTLGIITKAQIRIYEQPEVRRFRGFLFKDMSSAFKRAKVINVGVENNRYYLLHTRKHKAVITTLGDKILMACKAYRHKEGEMEDGSR